MGIGSVSVDTQNFDIEIRLVPKKWYWCIPSLEAQKQNYLENPDYTVLTARVEPRRLLFGSFGTLRQKTQEDMEEYVCPMNVQMPQSGSFHKGIYEDSLDQLEQMEDSEGTVRQIGAFSEEINNLTSMLKEEEFFREASPHSPETSATDDD